MRARGLGPDGVVRAAGATLMILIALCVTAAGAAPATAVDAAREPGRGGGRGTPGVLVVQTVPPIPGARVSADGTVVRADKRGIARLPVPTFVGLEERFHAPQTRVAKDRRVVLDRVRGQLHNAFNGTVIEVGLRTERLVHWTFSDREGQPIHPDRLTRVILRSSTGELVTLTGPAIGEPRWLAASRTQQTSKGLMSKDIYWSVQSVLMEGAELVNRSQQRFVPDESTQWALTLLFYRAEVRASDLLFGTPAGQGVEVTAPGGEVQRYPFDADGQVTLPAVPRGEYRMAVYGPGLSFTRPVSVSKDQQVELLVISDLDVALVVATVLLIAASLLVAGRRRGIATWMGRRRSITGLPGTGRAGARRRRRPSRRARNATSASAVSIAVLCVGGLLVAPAAPSRAAPLTPGTLAAAPSTVALAASPAGPIPVLAYYYIWFTPTSWRRAKIDYPLLGRYSSDDPVIMAEHIRLAQAAGIDGFLVSWKRTPQLNKRLASLAAEASAAGFRLGIVYQGLDFAREPVPVTQVVEDLDWLASTYGRDSTFRTVDQLPVVVWTGTDKFSTDDIQLVSEAVAGRLHVLGSAKSVDAYQRIAPWVDGNAYYWSSVRPGMPGYPEKLTAMGRAVHDNGGLWIPPFAPGFDARILGGTSSVPRDGGETLRRELRAAQTSEPDALGLISWNEFSENSHVEPSEQHGTSSLTALALALGATAPPAAADSGDEADGVAGVTGLGALVLLGLCLGLINLIAAWRRARRPAAAIPVDSRGSDTQ